MLLILGRNWFMGPDDWDNWFGTVFICWVYMMFKVNMFILFHFNTQLLDLVNKDDFCQKILY